MFWILESLYHSKSMCILLYNKPTHTQLQYISEKHICKQKLAKLFWSFEVGRRPRKYIDIYLKLTKLSRDTFIYLSISRHKSISRDKKKNAGQYYQEKLCNNNKLKKKKIPISWRKISQAYKKKVTYMRILQYLAKAEVAARSPKCI